MILIRLGQFSSVFYYFVFGYLALFLQTGPVELQDLDERKRTDTCSRVSCGLFI